LRVDRNAEHVIHHNKGCERLRQDRAQIGSMLEGV